MLHRAALATQTMNETLLDDGWELKDATPRNLLLGGTRPAFVDHFRPSRRAPGQLGWRAYGQFCLTALIPLLLWKKRGVPMAGPWERGGTG